VYLLSGLAFLNNKINDTCYAVIATGHAAVSITVHRIQVFKILPKVLPVFFKVLRTYVQEKSVQNTQKRNESMAGYFFSYAICNKNL
jgi:hypothetical protein